MLTFSFVTPSRSRIQQAKTLIKSIRQKSKNPYRIEICLLIDNDDPQLEHYKDLKDEKIKITKIFNNERMLSMGKMIDIICLSAKGDYLVYCNDDAYIETDDWDQKLEEIILSKKNWFSVFHINDGFQGDVSLSWPVYSKKAHLIGIKMCPHYYIGHFLDVHIKDVFKRLEYLTSQKLCFYINEIVFKHTHPLLEGGELDDVYLRRAEGNKLGGHLFLANHKDRSYAAKKMFNEIKKNNSQIVGNNTYKNKFTILDFFKSTLFSKCSFKWNIYLTNFFILIFLSNIKRYFFKKK